MEPPDSDQNLCFSCRRIDVDALLSGKPVQLEFNNPSPTPSQQCRLCDFFLNVIRQSILKLILQRNRNSSGNLEGSTLDVIAQGLEVEHRTTLDIFACHGEYETAT